MLQIFIYFNLFLAGAAVALAVWYAYAHFNSKKEPGSSDRQVSSEATTLPRASREELLSRAETRFKAIIDQAASELQYDLKDTSDSVSSRLKMLGQSISEAEMGRYKSNLQKIRHDTEHTFIIAAEEIAKHQSELHDALDKRRSELEHALTLDFALEKQRFVGLLDKKLAGSITAFLLETLGTDADLGAQSAHLMKTLEEHKAELIKELSDGEG